MRQKTLNDNAFISKFNRKMLDDFINNWKKISHSKKEKTEIQSKILVESNLRKKRENLLNTLKSLKMISKYDALLTSKLVEIWRQIAKNHYKSAKLIKTQKLDINFLEIELDSVENQKKKIL